MRMKRAFDRKAATVPLLVPDYSFVNLIGWNHARNYELSTLHGNIVIKGTFDGKDAYLPPIGSFRLQRTLAALLNETGRLIHMPERYVRRLRHHEVQCGLDRNNCDYLFHGKDLIGLKGKRFNNRRRLYKHFISTYDYTYRLLTPGLVRYVKEFQEDWFQENKERINNPHLAEEHLAALKVLDNYARLDVFGGVIMIDDKIKGYIIGEKLNSQTLLLHFEKCDLSYKGIFPALFVNFCKENPYRFVNMMQDLGIPNLRKAKLLFRPNYFLKKYTITKAPLG